LVPPVRDLSDGIIFQIEQVVKEHGFFSQEAARLQDEYFKMTNYTLLSNELDLEESS
jgi:hypothetical protein